MVCSQDHDSALYVMPFPIVLSFEYHYRKIDPSMIILLFWREISFKYL